MIKSFHGARLWTASSAVLLAGLIVLLAPRRTDAQYASPVRLMNSPAAPGVVSIIDDPGRTPYQSSKAVICSNSSTNFCSFNFGTVPAGHRLVIQNVAAEFN